MAPSALRPVFLTLRLGLHLLVVGLTLFVVVRALLADAPTEVPVTILAVAFLAWYGAGVAAAHRHFPTWARVVWLVALLGLWVAMSFLTPDAAFLAFPLFFLELHVLAAPIAVPLVVITFGLSVWGTATPPRVRGRHDPRSAHQRRRRDRHRARLSGHVAGDQRPAGPHPRPARHARGARRREPRGRDARRARAPRTRDPRHGGAGALEHPDAAARRRARRRRRAHPREAAPRARDGRREPRRDAPVHPRAHSPVARRADPARRAAAARRRGQRAGASSPGRRPGSCSAPAATP